MMIGRAASVVFPVQCAGCAARGEPLCATCIGSLRRPPPLTPPAGIAAWSVLLVYEGAAREVIARLKYRNARHAVGWLADRAAEQAKVRLSRPMAVAWVPTTVARRRDRGFDHAGVVARAVARRLGVPALDLLVRLDAEPQTGRNARERRVGPQLALRAGASRCSPVLLVDDVSTTGATLRSAARALRSGGIDRVEALVLARTLPPSAERFGEPR